MQLGRRARCAIVLGLVFGSVASASAGESLFVEIGETFLSLDPHVMNSDGLWVAATGEAAAQDPEGIVRGLLTFLVGPSSEFTVGVNEDGVAFLEGSIRPAGEITVGGPAGQITVEAIVINRESFSSQERFEAGGRRDNWESEDGLILGAMNVEIDPLSRTLLITSDDVKLSAALAYDLGLPKLAGQTIGTLAFRARLVPLDGEVAWPRLTLHAGALPARIAKRTVKRQEHGDKEGRSEEHAHASGNMAPEDTHVALHPQSMMFRSPQESTGSSTTPESIGQLAPVELSGTSPTSDGSVAGGVIGPDVIVGVLPSMGSCGTDYVISAFSV